MAKLFLKLLFTPICNWVGAVLNVISVVLLVFPELEPSINLGSAIVQIRWYGVAITGLSIWLLTSVWYATRVVHNLQAEIADVDISVERDTESYLGKQIVYLVAKNKEDIDIRDCYAYVSKLDYRQKNSESEKVSFGKDYRMISMLLFNNLNRNKLSWASFDIGEEKIIRAGDEERIDIAKIEKKKLVFIFEKENSSTATKQGEYDIVVELGGYSNGRQIKRSVFSGVLRYVVRDGKHEIYLHPKTATQQSVHLTGGILARFQAFFKRRKNPAPKQNLRPPTRK
jgi:hypothetical protein